MDRISELPEPILQQILSYLPIKQVVQSTLFSTTWKHVCSTFPILQFDKTYFDPDETENLRKKGILYGFVEKSLQTRQSRSLRIKKFTLIDCLVKKKSASRIDRWIRIVVESDVEELNLCFDNPRIKHYCVHKSVLVANSLTVLNLGYCKLDSTGGGHMHLSSLKKLSLHEVYVDDQFFQNLVVGCPLIEFMSFNLCSGLKSIKLPDLPKLRAIVVKDNRHLERVELESSNLYKVVIEQTATPCEINLVHCKNIKELNLRAHITDKWLHDHLSELPLIEILSLVVCSKLERIKISSHHLKSLELLACANIVEVKIDAPNLCRLWYYYKTIISFSMNGLALSEAIYHSMSGIVPWNVERIEFLSKLSNSKVLKLMFPSNERGIIPKELRETVSSPSYNVKHLHLYQPSSALSYTRHEINELMDSLLWISPLLDILTIECSCKGFPDFYKITFKFSYEKPSYKGDNPSCCKFLPFPCWRHCLKTVKIDNFRGFADREILHKYFFENAKSLEDFLFYDGAIA